MMTGVTQAVVGGGGIIARTTTIVVCGGGGTGGIVTTTDDTPGAIVTADMIAMTIGAGTRISVSLHQ